VAAGKRGHGFEALSKLFESVRKFKASIARKAVGSVQVAAMFVQLEDPSGFFTVPISESTQFAGGVLEEGSDFCGRESHSILT
jgi:hypothetical protein